MTDLDPLTIPGDGAAMDWAAEHRVPWALVFMLRRAASTVSSPRWAPERRAFVTVDHHGRELAEHRADDPFWWGGAVPVAVVEEAPPAPAVAPPPPPPARAVAVADAEPVVCECGLTVTFGGYLGLHRMGVVHQERMAAREGAAA